MKAVAISLSVLVLIFLVNLAGIFVFPAYKLKIQEIVGTQNSVATPSTAWYKDEVTKLQETVERLTVWLDALTQTGVARPVVGILTPTLVNSTGSIISRSGATSSTTVTEKPKPKEFTLGIPLQAKLMPDVFVKKVDNKGIFDIKIYSNLDYSTYRDEKNKMNVYAFADSYSVILANLKLASNVYTVKETDSFFEASFFLNSTNAKDTTIRFVTSIEGKAYGFEVPKSFYPRLKKLLTHK